MGYIPHKRLTEKPNFKILNDEYDLLSKMNLKNLLRNVFRK